MTDYTAATYGDRIAEVYDELLELAAETDAAVEVLADLAVGGPVLELGIGTGRLALPLARRGLPGPVSRAVRCPVTAASS